MFNRNILLTQVSKILEFAGKERLNLKKNISNFYTIFNKIMSFENESRRIATCIYQHVATSAM